MGVAGSRSDGSGNMGGDEVKYIKMLFYENERLSLTRTLAVIGWLAFLFVSFYLVWRGTGWQNYETFASLTGGGGAATQIANKFINSKYNSAPGAHSENKIIEVERK